MVSTSWGSLRKTAEDASKPLPKDWYDVQVEKAELTTSSTNKPMIKVVLQVMSGPQAGNRKVWTQFVFSPDSPFALQMFFKNMAAFGLDEKFFDSLPEGDPEVGLNLVAAQLTGCTARALIAPRTFNGTDRDNVVEITAPQGGASRPAVSVAPAPSTSSAPAGPPTPNVPAGPPTPGTGAAPTSPPQLTF